MSDVHHLSDVHHHILPHRDVSDEGSSSSRFEKPSAHGLHVDHDYEEPLISLVHKKWDDRAFTRVKLICSYGGRILLRPHDNQLRYVGGDTHVVVVSRNVTFSELTAKLSKTFGAQSAAVLVKYQLPCQDLDTLISVVSEDDLENMMEEHDRLEVSSGSRARLRLFLFPSRLERSYTVGISDHHSRERWFVDALNDNCSYFTPPLARVQSEIPSIISEAAPTSLTNMDAVEEWAAVGSHNNSSALEQTSFEKVVDSGCTGAMPSTTLFSSLLQLHHAAAAVGSIDGPPSSAPSSPLKRNPMEQPLVDANFSASSSAPPAVISALSAAARAAASKGSRKPGGSYEELGFLSNHQHPTAALPSRFGASTSRPLL